MFNIKSVFFLGLKKAQRMQFTKICLKLSITLRYQAQIWHIYRKHLKYYFVVIDILR